MVGIIRADTIQNEAGAFSITASHMQRRVIQRLSFTWRNGWWRPDNAYYWVPGSMVNFKPMRGDTRIRYSTNIPIRQRGNSAHSISHWIFFVDNFEFGRYTRGGHHIENDFTTEWDLASWGANQTRAMGFKVRSYSDNNHDAHLYVTQYWDGAGNFFDIQGQTIVEEYTSAAT